MACALSALVASCSADNAETPVPVDFPQFVDTPIPFNPSLDHRTVSAAAGVLVGPERDGDFVSTSLDRGRSFTFVSISPLVNQGVVPRSDGTVLILAGGFGGGDLAILDPRTAATAMLPKPPGYSGEDSVTAAPDGRIFVIPATPDTREAYVLAAGGTAWQPLPPLDANEGFRRIEVGPDGTVWVTATQSVRTLAADSAAYAATEASSLANNRLFITQAGTLLSFAIGTSQTLQRSVNGGRTFGSVDIGQTQSAAMIEHSGTIYWGQLQSSDDGLTWQPAALEVFYVDDQGGYALDPAHGVVVEIDPAGEPIRIVGLNAGGALFSEVWPGRSGALYMTTVSTSSSAQLLLTWDSTAESWRYPGPTSLPTNGAAVVLEPAAGDLYISDGRTVHRSADGGASWSQVSTTGIDSKRPTLFYEDEATGTWYINGRVCGNSLCTTDDAVLLRSTDLGLSWQNLGRVSLVGVAPDGTMYATVFDAISGVGTRSLSTDGGASWRDQGENYVDAVSPTGLLARVQSSASLEVSAGPAGPWILLANPDAQARGIHKIAFDADGHLWKRQGQDTAQEIASRSVDPL